jgi:Fe-S oxidoreductase/nitrate reductase gamma subunit
MWNVGSAWPMYVLFFAALGILAFGLYRRVASWSQGKGDDERLSDWGRRLWFLLKEILLQRRVNQERFPGLFHSLVFYSFLILVVTTGIVALDYDFGTTFFSGWLYVFLTGASELAGLFILIGVGMALTRRLRKRPATLPSAAGDIWALLFVGGLVLTGFATEGLRLATLGDPWAWLSPVGLAFSLPFLGLSRGAGEAVHQVVWWTHTVLAMGWIASIPYTKFMHLVSLPTNVFFAKLRPRGELRRVDIEAVMSAADFDEENFSLGLARPQDFTWKQRLDFEACIGCGRCEAVCPASQAEHPFSPRQMIAACQDLLRRAAAATDGTAQEPPAIVGGALAKEFIWYCRTCTACMEVCPACIDHVDTLMEVRRHEVMMQGRVPTEAQRALKMLETGGNPFGPQADRRDWVSGMEIRVVGPGEACDVLYWIGCCTTFDPAKQKIATDLCSLMRRCGIDFGVLGNDERCCGDPARLIGDERLFQEIAKAQIAALAAREFKVLLTTCPHCYNVLKHEYPQLGGKFVVAHHSEFLHEMLWNANLFPVVGPRRKVVYHDPCYLGRYQKQYESPREVLRALPGTSVVEMRNARDRSLCCGGGGGHFWMDLKKGKRINNLRVEQAAQAGADVIATGCAFCLQMLTDGVKALDLDARIKVQDLATLVLESLPAEEEEEEKEVTPAAGSPRSGYGS